ncbi:MAG: fibronectin type III domain-containing protein, partial [Negativicutes bacterium]|nr:fibronectin type III domain-containing protein [Negativicutes bacterium]
LPVLNSISQTSAAIGSAGFTLTANGSSFVSSSVVNWNGSALTTTFVNSAQLTAAVPASKLSSAGTVSVTVFNPAPGGGSSLAQTFTLNNPLPVLSSLSPTTRATGTPAFTLSVSGSSFAPGAIVRWNSSDLPSTFVNSGLLTAAVPATDLTNPGTAVISVFNPAPGGGLSAGSLNLTLYSIDPAYGIAVSNLRPTFDWPAVAGATSYTLQASTNRGTLSSGFLNKTTSTASYSPTSDIPGNVAIYWRVRAMVNKVWGAWSETRLFYSPNPPKAPKLSSPTNNALTSNYLPSLKWSEASLPANTTFDHYDLQIANNTGFTVGLMEPNTPPITTPIYTFTTPLSPNTGYYWRVRAYNTAGQFSDWSSVYYLRSALPPPTIPNQGNGDPISSLKPTFNWGPVDGASNYTLQVSTSSKFSSLSLNKTVTFNSYTPTSNLPSGRLLYWRVRANGSNGPSLWSGGSFNTP